MTLQLAPLRSRWAAGQHAVAFSQVTEARRRDPDDPRLALIHGFMAIALGREDEIQNPLWLAAGHPDTRAAAIVGLAARADDHRVEPLLGLCGVLPAELRAQDSVRYAEGLLLWRADEAARALATWAHLTEQARRVLDEPLAAATLHHTRRLLDRGDPGEALLRLEAFARARRAAMTKHERRAWRTLALTALARGGQRLARAAAAHLQDGADALDHALVIAASDGGLERARALARAAADARISPIFAGFLRRSAAAELVRHGCPTEAAAALGDGDGGDATAMTVARLLCSDLHKHPAAWPAVRRALAREPERLERLLGSPPPSASDEQKASFWGARGDLDRAYAHLMAAARITPTLAMARRLLGVAHARARAAAPEQRLAAWRDCFAHLCAFLEHAPRLEQWIRERLGVYELEGDLRRVADELRQDTYRAIDRSLSELGTHGVDVPALKAELARERAAAAAMASVGRDRDAFGPLYAHRTGRIAEVTEWLTATRRDAARTDHASLIRDLAGLGRSEREIDRILDAEAPDPLRELRRWYSELGEASALKHAGEPAGAKQVAMRIYSAWTPPLGPEATSFAARNPGYGAGPRAIEDLRQDAAAMVCELELAVLTTQLGASGLDIKGLRTRLAAILREASAFGCDGDTRTQLSRLLFGKQRQLLEQDTLEATRAAIVVGREAAAAGVTGGEARQLEALAAHARHLAARRRYRAAAAIYEEAWKLRPRERIAGSNWIAMLLRHHERLLGQRRADEAAATLAELDAAVAAVQAGCGRDAVRDLAEVVMAVRRGAPLADVVTFNNLSAGKAPPAIRPGLAEALAGPRSRLSGPVADLLAAAGELLTRLDDHPQALAALVDLVAPTLLQRAPADAAALLAWFDPAIEAQIVRWPGDVRLIAARAELDRVRPVAIVDDPIAALHAKALRLVDAGDDGPAVEILQTLFHLRPDPDVELCILLAESLVGHARTLRTRDPALADERRGTAIKVLTLASKLAPDHPRIPTIQALFDGRRHG